MRLNKSLPTVRKALVAVLVSIAIMELSTSAAADPLDPDRSFGHKHDGSVLADRWESAIPQVLGTAKGSTDVAGPALGGGSGEYYVAVRRFGRHGHTHTHVSFYGGLAKWLPPSQVVATFRTGRRTFSVGWAEQGWSPSASAEFGFVGAFQRHRPKGARWGTERFYSSYGGPPSKRGLERLREIPLSSVAAGAIDSARRVVVVGQYQGDVIVTRLTANGDIDWAFGTNGYARLETGDGLARAFDVAIDNQNRILVAGAITRSSGRTRGFVARLDPDGSPSASWAGDGLRLIGSGGTAVREIEPARHGRWLVGFDRQPTDRVRLVKLGSQGEQLRSFGRHGYVSIACHSRSKGPSLVALTVSRQRDRSDRVAAVMACRKSGQRRQLAGVWFTNGGPVPALAPSGVGRLPWNEPTIDAQYTGNGKLMLLHGAMLTRLHG